MSVIPHPHPGVAAVALHPPMQSSADDNKGVPISSHALLYWSYALVGADTSAAAIPSVRGDYRSHYETILLVSFVGGR